MRLSKYQERKVEISDLSPNLVFFFSVSNPNVFSV